MLPGLDGVSVCRAIRAVGANVGTPILMLTAREGEADKVLGLESGADDYLTKPFGVRELMARVGALMRRHARAAAPSAASGPLRFGDLALDNERRAATVRGEAVELTKQEFALLFLSRRVQVSSLRGRRRWSACGAADTYVTERTVDTVISRLRRKIERDPQDPEMLLTAWGVGYKFADV
jgi:DNA-binding response OmpR family regulator